MAGLVVSPEADADLAVTAAFIAERDGFARATAVTERIWKTMRNLAAMPGMGSRKSYLDRNTRSFPVSSWTIVYTLREDGITVIRILHGHRDLPAVFRKNK